MFDFSNFKVFDFSEGQPYMTVTNNGVIFSKGVVAKLNKPEFITLMIDYSEKRVAIKACNKHIKISVPFYKSNSQFSYVRCFCQQRNRVRMLCSDTVFLLFRMSIFDSHICASLQNISEH